MTYYGKLNNTTEIFVWGGILRTKVLICVIFREWTRKIKVKNLLFLLKDFFHSFFPFHYRWLDTQTARQVAQNFLWAMI